MLTPGIYGNRNKTENHSTLKSLKSRPLHVHFPPKTTALPYFLYATHKSHDSLQPVAVTVTNIKCNLFSPLFTQLAMYVSVAMSYLHSDFHFGYGT